MISSSKASRLTTMDRGGNLEEYPICDESIFRCRIAIIPALFQTVVGQLISTVSTVPQVATYPTLWDFRFFRKLYCVFVYYPASGAG